MNWDRIEGNWKEFKGRVREQWGKLTDDDLERAAGKRDQLIGRIQERYGIAREVADRQVNDWLGRQREDTRGLEIAVGDEDATLRRGRLCLGQKKPGP